MTRTIFILLLALVATPAAGQVGRTKERPTPAPTRSTPKPTAPVLPPAPREPLTAGPDYAVAGASTFALAWHPRVPVLAVGDAKAISIHGRVVATGEVTETVSEPGRGGILSIAYSPDGEKLAVGGHRHLDPLLWLISTTNGKRTELQGHAERITAVAFNRGSSRLASASWDGSVRVWDATTGEKLLLLAAHGSLVTSVAYGGDKFIATGCEDRVVRVWDARTGELFAALRGHTDTVQAVAFAGDGRTVVSCGNDGTVRYWDLAKKSQRAIVRTGKSILFALALDPDGQRIAAGGDDGVVRVWNLAGQEVSLVTVGKAVRSIAWAPDGQTIAIGDIDGGLQCWKRAPEAASD